MASKSSVVEGFEKVKGLFGVERLKEEQIDILTSIIRGEDCVAVLPTGFGKSLPYQVAKNVSNELDHEFHKVIVCSPLISLMQDQVSRLHKYGNFIKAMYKGQEDCSAIEDYDIIFSSPEHLVGNADWREALSKLKVSLLVVDEFHTVSTWGELSKDEKQKIFRRWFRHIGELRSIFPDAALLALSATCTGEIFQEVTMALGMTNAKQVIISPDKVNIRYSVIRTGRVMEASLFWLVDELQAIDVKDFPRTLIYCNSIQDVGKVFTYLKSELSNFTGIEMYHSETDDEKKSEIVSDLCMQDGILKIVVCTSALGMGVDISNCQNIILYGPARNVVDLVQIVGRAGRDGNLSNALIMCNSYQISHVDKDVKEIIVSDSCRRQNIMKHFLYVENKFDLDMHRCCDKCAEKCDCQNCELPYLESLYVKSHTVDTLSTDEDDSDSDALSS